MRLTIILLLVSAVCFGQGNTNIGNADVVNIGDNGVQVSKKEKSAKLTATDSLALPIFSTKEVMDYIIRIEKVAASIKNLRLTNDQEYNQLTAELNAIIKEMDKKRKGK